MTVFIDKGSEFQREAPENVRLKERERGGGIERERKTKNKQAERERGGEGGTKNKQAVWDG